MNGTLNNKMQVYVFGTLKYNIQVFATLIHKIRVYSTLNYQMHVLSTLHHNVQNDIEKYIISWERIVRALTRPLS